MTSITLYNNPRCSKSRAALGLDRPELTDTALQQPIVDHPLLLQRPLAMARDKAAVGRPPENVLELLK